MLKLNRTPPLLYFALTTIFLPISAAPPCRAGSDESAEARVIENPATPPGGSHEIMTEHLWSIGGEDDLLLGFVSAVLCDEQERVFLLDAQLSIVHVHDADGQFLHSFGRAGDGPGEFRSPQAMFFISGNRLAVTQVMPARISIFELDGTYVDTLDLPHEGMTQMVSHGAGIDDATVIEQMVMSFSEKGVNNHTRLLRLDGNDEVSVTYAEFNHLQTLPLLVIGPVNENDFSGVWSLLPDGRVVIAPSYHRYELHIFAPDGRVDRIVRREYEPVELSAAVVEKSRERFEKTVENVGQTVKYEPEPFLRAVSDIQARPNGEFWVRSARPVPDSGQVHGVLGPFEVYDSEGKLLRELQIVVPYDPERDAYALVDDRVFITREFSSAAANFYGSFAGNAGLLDSEDDEIEPAALSVEAYRLVIGSD